MTKLARLEQKACVRGRHVAPRCHASARRVSICAPAERRGISDGAEELRGLSDWTRYLELIDRRLAEALDRLGQALAAGMPGLSRRPGPSEA